MYQVDRILNALFGRVGWKQPTQSEYAILDEDNAKSSSGRYFQSAHAAVTIKNIKETQQDEDISDADFNLYLVDLQKSAILKTLSAVFNQPEVIETGTIFGREPNLATTSQGNTGKFVGYKVKVAEKTDYSNALSRAILLFDEDVAFELKCFVDNKDQALWTKAVTARANEATIVDIDDLVLSWMGKYGATSTFYIGYFQDDLGTAKAINEPVSSWMQGLLWDADSMFATSNGVKFNLPYTEDSLTKGLNLEFTSYRDFTSRIIANKALFDEAVSLQVACDAIELILSSTRSNGTERMAQEQLADLHSALNQELATNERPYTPGLKVKYAREIEKLQKAFFGNPKIESYTTPYAVYQG